MYDKQTLHNAQQGAYSHYQRLEDAQLQHQLGRDIKKYLPHWLGANFGGEVFNYFAFLRGAGYFFDAMYAPLVFYFMGVDYKDRHRVKIDRGVHRRSDAARMSMNRIEAASFMGLAGVAAFTQHGMMKKQMAEAVGAEEGINPDKVTYGNMRSSHNPIIESGIDFFQWNNIIRFGTSAFFLKGLQTGILAKIIDITLQRTLFSEGPAYEAVEHLVHDVHESALGERTTEDTVNEMVRILQRVQREHNKPTYSQQVIEKWIPALTTLTHAMEKDPQVGINEVIHALGGDILVVGDAAQTSANMQHMLHVGLRGLAKEKHQQLHGIVPKMHVTRANEQGVVNTRENTVLAA